MFLPLFAAYFVVGSVSRAAAYIQKKPTALSWPGKDVRPIWRRISRLKCCFARISSSNIPWKSFSEELWSVSHGFFTFIHSLLCYFYLSLVCLQHFAILLKYIIHVAIPDIPTWVREEMAKLDYQRREAFKVNFQTMPESFIQEKLTCRAAKAVWTTPH